MNSRSFVSMAPNLLISAIFVYVIVNTSLPPPERGAKYCDEYVCLYVCLSVCLSVRLHI